MRRFGIDRLVISVFVLAFSATVSVAASEPNQAATTSRETPISFDIPSQALVSALDRYGDATGREVFYNTALAAGRRSGGVRGFLTPEAALRTLLEGTGLSARFMADDSFVLLPALSLTQQPAVAAAPPAIQHRYYALIQASLRDAFCRNSDVQPGRYRVAIVFWIGPSGNLQRYQRLGSTGTSDIDKGIDDTLRTIGLDEPPPAGFRQPVLIMIVPQAPGVTMGCKPNHAGLRPVRAEP